jgi:hypothetical protein
MRRVQRNFGRDIVMKLAPLFSRGAAAFAPVAFPGKITYPANPGYGTKREFVFCREAPATYDHLAPALIDPAGGRFHPDTTRNVGLMPMNVNDAVYAGDPGGDPNRYGLFAENYLNAS